MIDTAARVQTEIARSLKESPEKSYLGSGLQDRRRAESARLMCPFCRRYNKAFRASQRLDILKSVSRETHRTISIPMNCEWQWATY
jgi:hypothetical protein